MSHVRPSSRLLQGGPLLLALCSATPLVSAPSDGTVRAGHATITAAAGTTLITQQSDRAIIDWRDFSVGAGEQARFEQPGPDSAVLNRVVTDRPSALFGEIQANGRIFLINPGGILIGADARIEVGGFLASTLDVPDHEFAAAGYLHFSGTSTAAVANAGSITASTGDIDLFARQVANAGRLAAGRGSANLAAGSEILLAEDGAVRVRQSSAPGTVANHGDIAAAAVELRAAGGNPAALAINNTGLIRATGTGLRDGRLWLVADRGPIANTGTLVAATATGAGGDLLLAGATVTNTGTLAASGPATTGGRIVITAGAAAIGGNIAADGPAAGGAVSITADRLILSGSIQSVATEGRGGTIALDSRLDSTATATSRIDASGATSSGTITDHAGRQLTTSGTYLAASSAGAGGAITLSAPALKLLGATLTADGATAGGRIAVGDRSSTAPTQTLALNDGAALRADGLRAGAAGGTLVLWSDRKSAVYGRLSARPGPGGAGGFIEASSAADLLFGGSADAGRGGRVLFDPKNLTIGTVTAASQYNLIFGYNYDNAAAGIAAGDAFGAGVALDAAATRLAVGAPGDDGLDGATTDAGAVYLFAFSAPNFGGATLQGIVGRGYAGGRNLDLADLQAGDAFGAGVALNAAGTRLAVGAPGDSGAGRDLATAGAVHLLQFTDNSFTGGNRAGRIGAGYPGAGDVALPALEAGDAFGAAIALNAAGTRLAVGAIGDDGLDNTASDAGAVHLLRFGDADFGTGLLVGTMGAGYPGAGNPAVRTYDSFGSSVALNAAGTRLAIGAEQSYAGGSATLWPGAVYLVNFTDGDFGGASVAGIVGQGHDGPKDINIAALDSTASTSDNFGSSVALSADGRVLAIGAARDAGADNTSSDAGAVYLLGFADGDFSSGALRGVLGHGYTGTGNAAVSSLSPGAGFGSAVALDAAGTHLVVGAPADSGAGGSAPGAGANYFLRIGQTEAGLPLTFGTNAADDCTLSPETLQAILATGSAVTLQANNDITVARAVTVANPAGDGGALTLQAGRSILLHAGITTDNGALTLVANDHLASGVVDAHRDAGPATIAMDAGVALDTGTGAMTFDLRSGLGKTQRTSGAIVLGDLVAGSLVATNSGATTGSDIRFFGTVTTANSIAATAAGDIALAASARLSAAGGGTTIDLAAQGSFRNAAGTAALDPGAGRWLVWSADPATDTRDGLAYGFKQYAATHGTTPVAQASGNGFLHVLSPTIAPALTGATAKNYDGTLTASLTAANITLSGAVDGDTVALRPPFSAVYADRHAGEAKTVTVSDLSIASATNGAANVYGYALGSTAASGAIGTITPKQLTASLTGSVSRTYDQTTVATLGAGNYSLVGLVSGDTVALNNPTAGSFDSRHVGSAKTVSVSGLALTGVDSTDYSLAATAAAAAIGAITPATLSASLTGSVSKIYDRSTATTLAPANYSLAGVFSGDAVALNNPATGSFADWYVGSAKLISVTGLTVSGADSANYSLASSSASAAIGTITPASLTASLTGSVSKVYSRTTAASLEAANYSLAGVLSGDAVALNNPATGSFADWYVGAAKTISVSGLALAGADSANYSLTATSAAAAIGAITPATLTASLTGSVSKSYDRSTAATLAPANYSLAGVFSGDAVSLNNPAAGSFADWHVGSAKSVAVSGLALSGTDAANYSLASSSASAAIGSITAKSLVPALTGAVAKSYDRSTAATLTAANYSLAGVFSGDAVSLNNPAAGSFADRHVGSAKSVSASGLALTGADAANYSLTATSAAAAIGTITPASLTASGVTAADKVYNRSTATTVSATSASLVGLFAGDTVTLSDTFATGSFAEWHVGSAKPVTVSGLALAGADAANYTLTQPSAAAAITPATLTASLTGALSKIYDRSTTAALTATNYSLAGVFSGDAVSLNNPAAGSFADRHVGTAKSVAVSGLALSGADAANYSLASSSVAAAIGTITAKPLTVSGITAVDRTYDRSTTATLDTTAAALVGIVAGDALTIDTAAAAGAFANKTVGLNKTVAVAGLALAGADAADYAVIQPSASADITAVTLTAGLTGSVSKVYNRSTAATLAAANYSLSGALSGDTVALNNPVAGTFDTRNVGTGKTISVTGLALAGTDAANYSLASSSVAGAIGSITARPLSASLLGSVSKIYDQTTAAALAPANYSLAGVLSGDVVALNNPAAGSYNDKSAGTAKSVTVTGLALTGADAANYSLPATSLAGAVGTITPATLSASGVTAADKVYNRSTATTVSAALASLVGVFAGDTVSVSDTSATGVFSDWNIGAAKAVAVSGLALAGTDAANYSLTQSTTAASITPATLTASLTGSVSKIYDRTTTASLSAANYSLSGVFAGDTVSLNNPNAGSFADWHVGAAKSVSVSGLALAGANASNYSLAADSATAAIGSITAKPLTVSGLAATSRLYDRTTTAAVDTSSASLVGVISGDSVALGVGSVAGTFANKTVGVNKTVTVSGLALAGTDAANYSLTQPTATASITAVTATAALQGSVTKVYNRSTAATLAAANYALSGILSGDTVALNNPVAGTFDTRNVGTGKTVTVAGLALAGADAANYALAASSASSAIGSITARSLTASLTGSVSKVYDQTTTAALAPANYSLAGVIAGDTVALNNPASGTYNTKAVGAAKSVSVAGLALAGADAANYALAASSIAGAVGTITRFPLSVTGVTAADKVYDRSTATTVSADSASLVGPFAGDVVAVSDAAASGAFADWHVGAAKPVTVSSLALTGTDAANYSLAQPTTSASITPATLAASLTGSVSKVYDRSATASLAAANYSLSGVFAGDSVALNNPAAGAFADWHVGAAKSVAVAGLALSGANAANYSLAATSISAAIGAITAKPLTVSGITAADKPYDRSTAAALDTATATLVGVVTGDSVALDTSSGTGAFASKTIGANKTVAVAGLTLSGADLANYSLIQPSAFADITTISLAASLTGSVSKVYDRSTTATLAAANYSLVGVLSGDVVSLNNPTTGAFADWHVGSAKSVSVTGLALAGADSVNYSLATTTLSGAIGTITAKPLTPALTGSVSKVYDRTITATLSAANYSLPGVVTGDSVSLNNPAGSFADWHVGSAKSITVSGLALAGTDAANYSLAAASLTAAIGSIAPATLTVTGVTAADKPYARSTATSVSAAAASLVGLYLGDTVALSATSATGTFDDWHVGAAKPVAITGLTLTGADASNYSLTQPSAAASITPATLTASLTGSVSKIYDRTTAASLVAANYSLAGVFSGDSVSLNNPVAGSFADWHVGSAKSVAVTGLALAGADAANYSLTASSASAAIGSITPASLTASLTGSVSKVYDRSTTAALDATNYSLAGVLSGDAVSLNNPTAGSVADWHVGSAKSVAVAGLALAGADAANYSLAADSASAAIGSITPATLTASLTGSVSKVYDRSTAATLAPANYSLTGVLSGDTVSLNNPASGSFADWHVGSAKSVSVTGLALAGADAANYSLAADSASAAIGAITPATLTAALTGSVSKVYDRSTAAALTAANYSLTGVLSGDAVSLNNPAAGSYADRHVGSAKSVAVSGLALAGANAANYSLAASSASAAIGSITPATLSVSGVTAADKIYDRSTTTTVDAASATLVNLYAGDSVSVSASSALGTFANWHVGSAKPVTVSGLALAGADAANYSLTQPAASAAITPASLTASLTGSVSKIYDRSTAASLDATNYSLAGVFTDDSVSLNNPAAGSFADWHVGSAKSVAVSGLALTGADAANYSLASSSASAAIGSITPATLTASLIGSVSKVYDRSTAASLTAANYSLAGLFAGDSVSLNSPAAGSFDSRNVGSAKSVAVSGLALAGADAANYSLAADSASAAIGSITTRPLTVVGVTAADKTYDRTTTATLSFGGASIIGVISGDMVRLGSASVAGEFDTALVGPGKTVTITGLGVSGLDAGNYSLAQPTASAAITARALSVSLTGSTTKTYDAGLLAALAAGNFTLGGVLGAEDVTLSFPTSGTFDSRHVGTAKTVTATGLALSGTDAANYSLPSAAATGAIGTITPASLVLQAATDTRAYDRSTASAATPTHSALLGSDTLSGLAQSFDSTQAGARTLAVNAYTIDDGNSGLNYSVTLQTATGSITTASLTASLTGAVSKVYDRSTTAALDATNYSLAGVFSGDSVSLNNPAAGSFADWHVGSAKSISVTGLALSGTDAANYSLASSSASAAIGSITPATLTAALTGSVSKIYDRTTAATLTAANYSLAGVFSGDSVSLNNPAAGSFADWHVGSAKSVSVAGLALAGADSSNYSLAASSASAAIGSITPATLTASLIGSVSKIYDRSTAASLDATNYSLAGVFFGDAVSLNSPAAGSFDSRNVGSAKSVAVSGLALAGADAANYSLTADSASAAIGSITPASLTASITGSVSKVYDGTTTASLTPANYTLAGVIAGDSVTIDPATAGSFADKNAGSAKTVAVTGLALSGVDSTNYALAAATAAAAVGTITPAPLHVTVADSRRVYGEVNPTFKLELHGLRGGDDLLDLSIDPAGATTAATATSNIGTYTVTPPGVIAANYTVQPTPGHLVVEPAQLRYAADQSTRRYGDTNPAFTGAVVGFVNGDTLGAATSGTLTFSTAATTESSTGRYAIHGAGLTANNGNYRFAQAAANSTALIVTPATLTVRVGDVSRAFGLPNPVPGVTFDGFVLGQNTSVLGGTLTFSTAATSGCAMGNYPINASGLTAANYDITYEPGCLTVNTPQVTVNGRPVAVCVVGNQPLFTPQLVVVDDGARRMLVPMGADSSSLNPVDRAAVVAFAQGGRAPAIVARPTDDPTLMRTLRIPRIRIDLSTPTSEADHDERAATSDTSSPQPPPETTRTAPPAASQPMAAIR